MVGGHCVKSECPYQATDGSCLEVNWDERSQVTKITGRGKDGVTRTLNIDSQLLQVQPEPITICQPTPPQPPGQTSFPYVPMDPGASMNCASRPKFVVVGTLVTFTYNDSADKYLKVSYSVRPALTAVEFSLENKKIQVTSEIVGSLASRPWAPGLIRVQTTTGVHFTLPFEFNLKTGSVTGPNQNWSSSFPELTDLDFFNPALRKVFNIPLDINIPPPPASGWGTRAFGDAVLGYSWWVVITTLGAPEVPVLLQALSVIGSVISVDKWQNDQQMRDKTWEGLIDPVCSAARTVDEFDALIEPNVPSDMTFFHAYGCDKK